MPLKPTEQDTGATDPHYWEERFDKLETIVAKNAATAAQVATDVKRELAASTALAAEAAAAIRRELGTRIDRLDAMHQQIMSALVGLQRNQLRMLGIASLLGGVLIFIFSRALGL